MPFNVISLNVNSIVYSCRQNLLRELIIDTHAEIYLLQETKLDNLNKLKIDGYNVIRCDIRRGTSGVCILIKNDISIRNVKCYRDKIHAVSIEAHICDRWIRFGSFYIPHNIQSINDNMNKFFGAHLNSFLGGDTNSRHASFGDVSSNIYGNALASISNTSDLRILNPSSPTCYKMTDGSFIDKFIMVGVDFPADNIVVLPSFSDHFAISCSLPFDFVSNPDQHAKINLFHRTIIPNLNGFIQRHINNIHIQKQTNLTDDGCD